MVYLATGKLPWMGYKNEQLRDRKYAATTSEICQGLPDTFAVILDYVKGL
jgi:hypothetical protein